MNYYVISVLLVVLFHFYRKFKRIADSVAHIPGPRALPFVGNALMFVGKRPRDLVDMGEAMIEKYGFFMRILLGPKVLILLAEPEDIEDMLLRGKTIVKSEEYEYTQSWIGEGLITSTGQKWFSRRKVITPAFHFNILQSFVSIFEKNSNIFVEKLKKFESVNISRLTLLLALDNICEAAMGTKINAQSNSDASYVKAVAEISRIITLRHFLLPLRSDFIFKLSGYKAKETKLLKVLHGFTDSVIVARRAELEKKVQETSKEAESKDKCTLMDILLQSTIDGQPLSNLDIREEVDTFMFAGHDTTTSGISFCLYNIAKYPEVQQKVFEEIKAVFHDPARPMELKDFNELHYLELVIKETLRLYSPVPFIGRKIKEDTEINGKVLPKGSNVVISPFIMGRNGRIWENPKSFIPERFELENLTNLNPFSYLPFSAGPRNCIGQKFAMLEMKCTIVKVLQSFEISLEPGFKLVIMPEIVLKPAKGIKLRLKAR